MSKPPFKKGDRVVIKESVLCEQTRGRHATVKRVMHKKYQMHVAVDGGKSYYIHPDNLEKEQ